MKLIQSTLLSVIILTSLGACNKLLNTTPVNAVSDDNPIFDAASSETALRGVYRQLGSTGYYGETYVTLGYFPS